MKQLLRFEELLGGEDGLDCPGLRCRRRSADSRRMEAELDCVVPKERLRAEKRRKLEADQNGQCKGGPGWQQNIGCKPTLRSSLRLPAAPEAQR